MLSPGREAARGGLASVSASGLPAGARGGHFLPASAALTETRACVSHTGVSCSPRSRSRSAPRTPGRRLRPQQKALALRTTGPGRAFGQTPWDAEVLRCRTPIRTRVYPTSEHESLATQQPCENLDDK